MTIYVVTNPEAGWDCVIGAYKTLKDAVEENEGTYIEGKSPSYYSDELELVIHKTELE